MHLNKILEQIKRHQSPTEAIDKLATALEKHEGSLLEKGFTILKSELAANMYEAINGPHFDEEHAHYAVEGMENEDGTKGPHWTVEETTSVANQMGINLKSEKHNKWDWFVAMNMIYSDFYKAVVAMTGSANTKYFAELAKAWLCDKRHFRRQDVALTMCTLCVTTKKTIIKHTNVCTEIVKKNMVVMQDVLVEWNTQIKKTITDILTLNIMTSMKDLVVIDIMS